MLLCHHYFLSFPAPAGSSDTSGKEMTGPEEDDEFTVESESGSEEHPSDSEGIYMYIYSVTYR